VGETCAVKLRWKEVLLPMKTAAEYRTMAEECFKWAREAQAREVRESLRQLAPLLRNSTAYPRPRHNYRQGTEKRADGDIRLGKW
jgi:hypothetical protein